MAHDRVLGADGRWHQEWCALAGDRYRFPNIVQLADDQLVIHIFGPACRG
jgi:hypothetical protein